MAYYILQSIKLHYLNNIKITAILPHQMYNNLNLLLNIFLKFDLNYYLCLRVHIQKNIYMKLFNDNIVA